MKQEDAWVENAETTMTEPFSPLMLQQTPIQRFVLVAHAKQCSLYSPPDRYFPFCIEDLGIRQRMKIGNVEIHLKQIKATEAKDQKEWL